MEATTDNLNLPVPVMKANAIKKEFDFKEIEKTAAEWKKKADALIITDASQLTEMKKAGEGKKFLVTLRGSIEKKRVELKEDSLKEGKAIDAVAKYLKGLITPIEEDLESKEKYAILLEQQRQQELHNQRYEEITPFLEAIPVGINYGALDHGTYRAMLDYASKEHADRIALIESERIDAEEYQKKTDLFYDRRLKLAPYSSYGFFDLTEDTTEQEFQAYIQEGVDAKLADDLEKENIRVENEKLKQKAIDDAVIRNRRQELLRPYIQFIRHYNEMLEMEESGFNMELNMIKKGAEDHWEFERTEQIRIQSENDARQKEVDNLHLQHSRAKQLASVFSGVVPFDYNGDLLYELTQGEFDSLYQDNKAQYDWLKSEEERIQSEKDAQYLRDEKARLAAESAPDKEKISAIITALDEIDWPLCETEFGQKTVLDINDLIIKVKVFIENRLSEM